MLNNFETMESNQSKDYWITYAWVKRGKRRQITLKIFYESLNPLSVNDIRAKSKVALSQASATVGELEEAGLIICLNPNDKIGKLYRISEQGKTIIAQLEIKK